MLAYIDGNAFNTTQRTPPIALADGTTVLRARYAPLQSDITTLISVMLSILRLITAAWLGPLIWRCAFILMERHEGGLKPGQLHGMISYGFPGRPDKGGMIVWIILAAVLPVHIIAPVLTGSITWVSYNQRIEQPFDTALFIPSIHNGSYTHWGYWNSYIPHRERACTGAAGLATIAWGQNSRAAGFPNTMKRVLPSISPLEVNSTMSNVTLPYFSVTKIDWVEDPLNTLSPDQLAVKTGLCNRIALYSAAECPLVKVYGTVALIPDSPSNATNRPFPSPSIISETRLMVMHVDWRASTSEPCPPFSHGVFTEPKTMHCWSFAWVTYTAGASTCIDCRVSSYSTVQNDASAPVVIEDVVASEALRMLPVVVAMMRTMNVVPFSLQDEMDDYIVDILSRSYAVSWTSFTSWLSSTQPLVNTSYHPAVPSSQALVDSRRVYIWLCMQLLMTATGVTFIYVQATSASPVIGDTTLVAFYLDSGDVSSHHPELQGGPVRKLGYDGSRLRVNVAQ